MSKYSPNDIASVGVLQELIHQHLLPIIYRAVKQDSTIETLVRELHAALDDAFSPITHNRTSKDEQEEQVNHPAHYGGAGNSYEAIKIIDAWKLSFALGNVVKYIARAGKKPNVDARLDLCKAVWYLNHEIERLGKEPQA